MKHILTLLLAFAAGVAPMYAQDADSAAFVSAAWHTERLPRKAVARTARMRIFDSWQTVSVVSYRTRDFCTRIVLNEELTPVAESAAANGAVAAVNAAYWNVKEVRPATYMRINGHDLSPQTEAEELFRVNGIAVFGKGFMDVIECDTSRYGYYASLYDDILAAGPVLVDEGREFDYGDAGHDDFYLRRHPRTAVGRTADGETVMVVVDGRFRGDAEGVTIWELTKICRWLGMTDALNLDGGGSSTMWYGGRVVNNPCDNRRYDHEGARAVSSSLLVLKK